MAGGAEEPAASDREGIEIGDVPWCEAGHHEGGLAWVPVRSLAFAPILSGLEVVVDRPEQRGPFEALV